MNQPLLLVLTKTSQQQLIHAGQLYRTNQLGIQI